MKRAIVFAAAMLATSSALADPTPQQCIAKNERSIELRNAHRLRESRDELLQCAMPTCPAEVRGECERRLAIVSGEIPSIVLAARDARGADLVDVRVLLDGALIAPKLDGAPIAVDPGVHVFRFEAPAQPSVEERVLVREGEKDRPIRVTIGAAPSVERRRDPTFRALGLGAGSAGLAGVIVGAIFGGLASSAWSRSESECRTPNDCTNHPQAVADHDDAITFATVSTITFIAGGVALAAGTTLFFAAPWVKPGTSTTGGVTFGARF
jgi:hypothetical protein